ncbi:gamma-glutamyltransferase [Colwellia sp. D2M02]|uniref:gamma-glutamyltransferase n=1 Tax=Colwellia sp. D2M02 TaxID=2841562 RepID=UPI001C0A15DC|nr:gamma-glutamyltransferase [Colwellia sp. D2M02]MBU2894343.1 gamma-glutamyltransferase [Colwellia sp. D2M02]
MFSFASPKMPYLLASSIIASLALIPEQVNAQNPSVIPTVTTTQINEQKSIVNYYDIHHPVIGRKGMVVSQSDLASKVGADILQQGGNAIDAAVAVGFALAVVLPRAGNLAGGGFMLVHLAKDDKTIAINYREEAPEAAHRNLFLNELGEVDTDKTLQSLSASGIPGTVAGLAHALDKYGTMSLAQVIAPAIELATSGFAVTDDMLYIIEKELDNLRRNAESCRVFFKKDCQLYQVGELFKQPDLANTLSYIAKHGAKGFYQGDIATKIVAEMQTGNGLITLKDLANYRVEEMQPLTGTFNGYDIVTMPPPSSGGVHLLQMLNMLEQLPIQALSQGSASMMHLQAEVFKRAYADRSMHLGDPDFVRVPTQGLISKSYAKKLAQGISLERVTPSAEISSGQPSLHESPDTTHFSVMDKAGNVVSNTYTLNHYFGSGITIPGTGFVMNNTMDDFSAKPGTANSYGLVGGEANAVAARKQPLSSMTPTIVFKNNEPYIATGTPGGSKIITAVFQQLVNVLLFDMNISEATNAPRIHHQWLPERLLVEQDIAADSITLLKILGYNVVESKSLGSLQAIMLRDGVYFGAADPRRPNAKAVAVN